MSDQKRARARLSVCLVLMCVLVHEMCPSSVCFWTVNKALCEDRVKINNSVFTSPRQKIVLTAVARDVLWLKMTGLFSLSLSLSLSLSPDASANMRMFRSNRINLLSVRAYVFVI